MNLTQFNKEVLPIKSKLYRYALSLVYDEALAEDIVQEVLVKLWTQRKKLTGVRNFEALCIKCIRNLAFDKLKSSHRRTLKLEHAIQLRSDSFPDKRLENSDLLCAVRSIMEQLPDKQKEIFRLRELLGYSNSEIQEILDLNESQVKVNLFRARKKIKTALTKIINYGLEP